MEEKERERTKGDLPTNYIWETVHNYVLLQEF